MSLLKYCPQCAAALADLEIAGRRRRACPDRACGYVHWDNPLPVVAALIEYDGQVLLARNAAWPEDMFALITGFLERDETPEDGIRREIREETNLEVSGLTLLGVYEFMRKNELIIAYHARCEGEIVLSDELVDYRLIAPHRLRPWRAGTGHAVAEWMRQRGLPFDYVDSPRLPAAEG
ncbi:NUDIX hydrolase [Pandoraea thiooxydans]|uniref:ADP-ribose pyrophosphatase n=1 Tax=Pandoraea thiooxydans TaxID=445709 RepID=A0A0G3ENQ0_9BURK|nr:NUDIX domain-containing protein [Pandoraea thiooxydans]AKJ68600.1 ADP-ribose pyrophosphatase [Pandoraea thiooxydans]APR96012.1 NUDIX hydrolase [Pandoraea thiooxydans]